MKKIFLLNATLCCLCFTLFAQNCITPISNFEFQQKFNALSARPGDEAKLDASRVMIANNCFTSQQIFQLAGLFNQDGYRLPFAKAAFLKVIDKKDFYDVLDAFKTFSYAFRLYHFIENGKSNNNTDPDPVTPVDPVNFPLSTNYHGLKGCGLPMADRDFDLQTVFIFKQKEDLPRMESGRNFINTNCISMAQFMKFSMTIELESNRLVFMKDNFSKIYDLENYAYAGTLFSHLPYRNEWQAFVQQQLSNFSPPPVKICEVLPADFQLISEAIKKESTSNTKLILAKQVISSKKCFRSVQIKELVILMSFENGKLELAKFAYDFCTDKENYYLVNDAFSFSSSKHDLINYLNNRK